MREIPCRMPGAGHGVLLSGSRRKFGLPVRESSTLFTNQEKRIGKDQQEKMVGKGQVTIFNMRMKADIAIVTTRIA